MATLEATATRPVVGLLAALAALLTAGCRPEIGDECTTSLDCSQLGERLCDTSQPDGYCTIFNCEPDTCPDEALCVGFGLSLDPACAQVEDPRWARFERTFCMYACTDDEDCRPGYLCAKPSERRAASLDRESENKDSKACFPEGEVARSGDDTSFCGTGQN